MRTKLGRCHFAGAIKLNVGGVCFKTGLETLRSVQGSLFAEMFSGSGFTVEKDEEDSAYFIDRDGSHFRHILNFLR